MNNDIVGNYYKRNDLENNSVYLAYHIIANNEKYYQAVEYIIGLGIASKENKVELQPDFYRRHNFKQTSKEEFELIEYLYKSGGKFEYDEK